MCGAVSFPTVNASAMARLRSISAAGSAAPSACAASNNPCRWVKSADTALDCPAPRRLPNGTPHRTPGRAAPFPQGGVCQREQLALHSCQHGKALPQTRGGHPPPPAHGGWAGAPAAPRLQLLHRLTHRQSADTQLRSNILLPQLGTIRQLTRVYFPPQRRGSLVALRKQRKHFSSSASIFVVY